MMTRRIHYGLLIVIMIISQSPHTYADTIRDFISHKRAQSQLENQNTDNAITILEDHASSHHASGNIHNNLGLIYAEQNDFENAERHFATALNKLPESAQSNPLFNLGNTYLAQQKLDDAIESYKQALLLNPSFKSAKQNLEIALALKDAQPTSNEQQPSPEEQQQNERDQAKQEAEQRQEEEKKDAEQLLEMLSDLEKNAKDEHDKSSESQEEVKYDW